MKKIAKNIFLETSYPGVNLGILKLKRRALIIDCPLKPDDAYSFQASLRSMGIGNDRLLINLDQHFDRTIGSRAMNTSIIAQNLTAEAIEKRSAVFKAQNPDSGTAWEECSGLSGIRWLPPNLFFSDRFVLNWGEDEVAIEHHPGPTIGASWVVIPEQNIVFVGDAVASKQPPFLADAHIDSWLESLDILLSKKYANFTVVSGRSGMVATEDIRAFRIFLADVKKRVERLARRKALPETTEKMVPKLLEKFNFPDKYHDLYTSRLRYGLFKYYNNQYYAPPQPPKKK